MSFHESYNLKNSGGASQTLPILDKIDGKFVPPSPQIKDEKMARIGFCTASSLIWGGGGFGRWGFAVPFYSVQDCRLIWLPQFGATTFLPAAFLYIVELFRAQWPYLSMLQRFKPTFVNFSEHPRLYTVNPLLSPPPSQISPPFSEEES